MGSPQSSHIEIQHQEFYLGIKIDGDSGLQFTNGSLMPTLEYLEIATPYIQITTAQSCQNLNADFTFAKLAEKSGRVRRSRRRFVDSHKACGCLIFVDAQDDTVNLIHQSEKDYLLSPHLQQHQKLAVYSIVQENANLFLFESWWKCLSLCELDPKSDELSMWFPAYCIGSFRPFHLIRFLDYAAERLSFHALAASRAIEKGHVWKDSYLDKRPLLRDFWLYQVSAHGHGVVTQLLLEHGANIGARVKTNRIARQP
jgi:hypothetical protein